MLVASRAAVSNSPSLASPWLLFACAALAACSSVTVPQAAGGTTGSGGSCAGACASCVPAVPWSTTLGSAGLETITGLEQIAGADGSVILSTLTAKVTSPSSTGVAARLTKFDSAGHVVWNHDGVVVDQVARDDACGAFVAGSITNQQTTLLDAPVACSATMCAYVARIGADGALRWLQVYGGAAGTHTSATRLARGAGGHLALAGSFSGVVDFGDGPIQTVMPGMTFLASLSPDGETRWSRQLDTAHVVGPPSGLAVGAAGDVVISGVLLWDIDFGAGSVLAPSGDDHTSAYVAAYDAAGHLRFGEVFGDATSVPWLLGAAIDPSGDILLSGIVTGVIDLGGGPVGASSGDQIIAARLDATGKHLWSRWVSDVPAGSPLLKYVPPIAVAPGGHVWLGGLDGALMELDSSGATVATRSLGATGHAWCASLAFGPSGAPVIAGIHDATVDLGQGPLTAAGPRATFVAALAP
jgi:hypothetical protein